jgi:bifunctional non-homologous end joining protein LigD
VGAGFTADIRTELLAAMESLAADESPFATPPPRAAARNAIWLRPEVVIRAEFAGWTGDGLVRQAAYKGFDLGKNPKTVVREAPA